MNGFFGLTVREEVFAGLRVVEKLHAPSEVLEEHEHEKPYATFVMGGEYVETLAGSEVAVPPGSVVLHPGHESHADRFGRRPATLINVEIPVGDGAWPEIRRAWAAGDPIMQMMGIRLRQELHRGDDLSAMIVEGIMLEVCGLMLRRSPGGAARSSVAMRAEALIRDRFAASLRLRDIAEEVGVGPCHLSRVFRKEMGCTVGERIRQRRVECASQLLATSMPLSEVAGATGFADQSHFTRTFRALTGVTPQEYRRHVR
ncbi:MAG TPA: helix-turn-helix transcriptional regulator [Thermoanaerobaculia bacterium]|nr:helix-turn-helix transcriptional regulator [Thermoanaerobaculia bacterium]